MKIRFTRKSLIITAGVTALALLGTGVLAAQNNLPFWHNATAPLVGQSKTATTTTPPSPEPTIASTPSTRTPGTPVTTPKPSPAQRYLDDKDGPCQGIHGADDGCVTKDAAKFQIASLIMSPKQISCTASTFTAVFNPLIITRHYLSGSSGMAQVQVDYSDGTSSQLLSASFTAASNIQTIDGISHTFSSNDVAGAKFHVHLVSPAQTGTAPVDQSWMPLLSMGVPSLNCPAI